VNASRRFVIPWVALFAAGACVDRASYETTDESDQVAGLILAAPPAKLGKRLDVDFGPVTLLGYEVDRDTVEPGGEVQVTWYWRCDEAPGPGWRLFTHLLDGEGRSRVNQDRVGPLRSHFQPEHWRPGLILEDPQRIRIPQGWGSAAAELRVGLWRGEERLRAGGGTTGSDRAKGPRLAVAAAAAPPLEIPWTATPPVIDGDLEGEDAWRAAAVLDPFQNTMDGTPAHRPTTVRLLWDATHLHVAMTAADDLLQTRYTAHDDELWNEDAFEVFLDPGGDRRHYYEIQVSPAGVVFDSHLPAYRKNRNAWSSAVRAAVALDGSLNRDGEEDHGWSAELSIPFASLDQGGGTPPAPGDVWKVNFFRVDLTPKGKRYSAWSPPLRGDFHALDRFGPVRFAGPRTGEGPSDRQVD
jgi:hypothetical protein